MITVNKKTIPVAYFQQEWARINQLREKDPYLQQMDEQALKDLTSENVINQFLLDAEVTKRKDSVPQKEIEKELKDLIEKAGNEKRFLRQFKLTKKQLPDFKKSIAHRLAGKTLISSLIEKTEVPTDDEVFEIFKKNPLDFGKPETIHVSHIVKHTNDGTPKKEAKRQIEQAKRQLDMGEDFEKLCRQYSDCQGNSGDLGWFPRGQMVQTFEDVVFKMKPGEVSDIFETKEFGFHIALVHEKKEAQIPAFETIKDQLKAEMFEYRKQTAVTEFITTLRKKAKITVSE